MQTSLSVLYSDDDIVAVDKPVGLLAVPDRYDVDAPVATNLLQVDWGKLLVVHRIDKDTSGVLIYARNAEAHRELNGAFGTGAVKKVYKALVRGLPAWEETECELPLRVDGDRQHRTVIDAANGKESRTVFAVLEAYKGLIGIGGSALLEAKPETGRTHQIRVHLASLGFPCLCDPLYGDGQPLLLSRVKKGWRGDPFKERPLLSRTALHAFSADFAHPRTGAPLHIEAQLPKDMRATITQFGKL
jgi:RluA family pseudouridine synthase